MLHCLDTILINKECTPQCYLYTVSDTSCNIGKDLESYNKSDILDHGTNHAQVALIFQRKKET